MTHNGSRIGVLEAEGVGAAGVYALAAEINRTNPKVRFIPSTGAELTQRLRATLAFAGADCAAVEQVAAPDRGGVGGLLRAAYAASPAANELGSAAAACRPAVLGIGAEGEIEALKFGLLSGRRVVAIAGAGGLDEAFASLAQAQSVTIAPGSDFSATLAHRIDAALSSHGRLVPHGYLYPYGEIERDIFLLKCVLQAWAPAPDGLPFRFFFPLAAASRYSADEESEWAFGASLSAADTVSALTENAEFVAITGHSNGIDMSVGNAVLCPRGEAAVAGNCKTLACFYGAQCSRKTQTNVLVTPSAIRSAVVVLYTCWGAVLRDHIYDWRTSLLFDLIRSPSVSAVATTYTSALMDTFASVEIAARFADADSMGAILEDVNARHFRDFGDERRTLLLFGDPEMRRRSKRRALDAGPLGHAVTAKLRMPCVQPGATVPVQAIDPELARARLACIEHARGVIAGHRTVPSEKIAAVIPPLCESVDRLWLWQARYLARSANSRISGPAPPSTSYYAELRRFHERFFAFFAMMVSELGGLLHLQTDALFEPPSSLWATKIACPYCGGEARIMLQAMSVHAQVRRRLHKCDNCAVTLDADAAITDGRIDGAADWALDVAKTFRVIVDTQPDDRNLPFLVGAVLEPFLKRRQNPPLSVVKTGELRRCSPCLSVDFASEALRPDLRAGCYFLNAVVLIGERRAFLRRAIYLHPNVEGPR